MELFSRAVEEIYAAAPEPSRWPIALQAIADCFGDIGSNLIFNRSDGATATIVSPGLQAASDDYATGWWQQDIRWVRANEYVYRTHAAAITDRHFVTEEEMATLPFYTDFQARHGIFWIASTQISPDPNTIVGLSIQRGPDKPAYSDDELSLLTQIGVHAEQSLRLSMRLIQAEVTNVSLGEALARLNTGVFVLDSMARILFSNTAAKRVLNDGLREFGSRLTSNSPPLKRALEEAITHVIGASVDENYEQLRPILIPRASSPRPLTVYVLPARASRPAIDQILNQARAIVLVIDAEDDDPPDPSLVRDVLGLTLGEARIASLVGSGLPPREAATKLGISAETVRTALKRVFAKVGVSRQSELAALMTRLVLR
jgi:DNA-binding CsgD family transcriptional regulator